MRRLQVRLDDTALSCGTWNLVFVLEDGTECFAVYKDIVNESGKGRLLELSEDRFEFDAKCKINYMCGLDRKSRFTIRKWRNKSDLIKKSTIIVNDFSTDGLNISLNIAGKNRYKCIEQAEVWIWSRALKQVQRLTVNGDVANTGIISIDLSDVVEKNSILCTDKHINYIPFTAQHNFELH